MAIIKNSQFPVTSTISASAYVPIIDLNQPVGSQNQIILATTLTSTGGVSNVTLDGLPVSTLDPTYFSFNGNGVTLQNIAEPVTVNGDPVTIMDTTYFTIGENGLTLQNIPTGAVVTINQQQVNILDPNQFGLIDGNGTATLTFSSVSDVGELSSDTVVLIASNDSVYTTTIGAISAYVSTVNIPSITLPSIPDQIYQSGDNLTCNGTLANYGNAPNLLVWINGAFVAAVGYLPFFGDPVGTINSSTSFSLSVPPSNFSSLGSYSIFVTDWIGTISNVQTFNVSYAIATGATISGSADSPVHGQPLTGFSVTLTPNPSSAYAVLAYNTGEQLIEDGSRQLFTGSLPTLTPTQINSNYQLWIVTTPDTNTGAFLAQSSLFAVS